MKHLFLIFFLLSPLISMKANDFPFQAEEELKFDIHYKYGLVMLKAGTANFKVENSNYNNNKAFKTTLDFKTSSFFDKIFKMRDTLSSYITENLQPLYHTRSIHEGNYHFSEEIFINAFNNNYTEARVRRVSKDIFRFDTIITANTKCYDLMNLITVICSFDYFQLKSMQAETVFGKDKITVTIRNEGQSVIEKSETHKFKTYKLALDFADSNFNQSKNAVEIWMSDDKNRIPIKIKAKLRIGAAEVHLSSWKNLKYPLSSEIIIPVKK